MSVVGVTYPAGPSSAGRQHAIDARGIYGSGLAAEGDCSDRCLSVRGMAVISGKATPKMISSLTLAWPVAIQPMTPALGQLRISIRTWNRRVLCLNLAQDIVKFAHINRSSES